jgi:3-(3-hydroxy-phenyl)propionate hydroxylase
LHAQPFDTWRIDFPVEDDEDAEIEKAPERIERRLDALLDMIGEKAPRKIIWTSLYRPRAVSLPTYRKGRMFLAGDCAHQTPIFGGRGLNLGLADATNLAWKLGYVVLGRADEALLDSYDRERRQLAQKTLSDLSQAAVFMARPTAGVTLMRDAVLDLTPHEPFVRGLFDSYRAPKREGYSQTASERDDPPKGAVAGNPLPNPPLRTADGKDAFLYDMLPQDFAVICFSASGTIPADAKALLNRLRDSVPCKPLAIATGKEPAATADAHDIAGAVRKALDAKDATCILVRPDGYIEARSENGDFAAIEARLVALVGHHVSS